MLVIAALLSLVYAYLFDHSYQVAATTGLILGILAGMFSALRLKNPLNTVAGTIVAAMVVNFFLMEALAS
jgi:hypothetical protein